MRTISPTLATFLASKQPFVVVDLFTITLFSGESLKFTSSEIAVGPFQAVGPMIQRSRWNMVNTIEVPELDLNIYAGNDSSFNVDGINIKLMIHNGGFDGSRIQLDRGFCAVGLVNGSYDLIGSVTVFNGRTSTIKLTGSGAQVTAKGDNVLFNQYMPRNVWQVTCLHTLYGTGCGVNPTSYTFNGTIGAGSTASLFNWSGSGVPSDLTKFINGVLLFTSGVNVGVSRTIQWAINTPNKQFGIAYPLEAAPSAGDTFTANYGCDKSLTTCTNSFANQANFRGFPYVPNTNLAY